MEGQRMQILLFTLLTLTVARQSTANATIAATTTTTTINPSDLQETFSSSFNAAASPSSTSYSPPTSPYSISTQAMQVGNSESSYHHPLLLYSIRYEIKSYDLYNSLARPSSPLTTNIAHASNYEHYKPKEKEVKTLIAGLKNTIGLDFYYSEQDSYIFWIDIVEERIYRGTMVNGTITNVEMVVQAGLANAEGLTVDWIGLNLYWVESTMDQIEVANMDGSSRRTLLAGDMDSPRAIAVDPRYGLLFWSDWDKKKPRIERATMSGDDRKTIVYIKDLNGGWPNGLTLDYEFLKVYWIDASSDSIHVVDYDGNNHQALLKHIKSLGHPFSITLYENNLYWTDWKTNSITTANKHNGSEVREIQRLTNRLFDIKVFHPSRQPRIDVTLNPCYNKNGDCSHLCLLSTNHTRKCECPHLMKLSDDKKTCEPNERVLLIGRTNEIRAVDLEEPLHHIMAPLVVPKVFNPRQLEYDTKSKSIFWVDSQTNEVKRAQLSGHSIDTIIDVIIESPSGLALDWISGNIYVTSSSQNKLPGKIYVSNLNGEYISVLMDDLHGVYSPKSLAVYPTLGIMFCIDENDNNEPIIFMAKMDGSNKTIIASRINNPKLENPSSLAIDYKLDRVFWINQGGKPLENASIQYYDIIQNKIVTIFDEDEVRPEERIKPDVLCVDGDYLMISGRVHEDAILKVSKFNLTERVLLKTQYFEQLSALRVYNASTQSGKNACSLNNGNCSQLCIPTSPTERTCKCTMGFTIDITKETECIGKDRFLIYSYNLGMKGVSLGPNASPDDLYLPPIHKAFRASSIDFVHRENLIYWLDNEEGSITRVNRDTTNYRVIVAGLESEESIAIDWVAGNIYWLDPYYNTIDVARLNGSNRYVIVSGDMEKANGLVVNPIKGYIAWSDVAAYPKIEAAQLDGSNRRVIVNTNLTHIDDLAIDYIEGYIYWLDSFSNTIERIKDDGTNRQIIVSINSSPTSPNHLTSIAIHGDYLYFADSVQHQGSVFRCNKNNGLVKRIIHQHLGEGIRDIAIFAEQLIPSADYNPCVSNNGGCQDLCMFMGKRGRRKCICSHGKLNSDGATCQPYDTFVMFSKLSTIDSLHIKDDESFNNSPYAPILIENRSNIISLTIDYTAKRVIYSEITRDQICSIFFNGTDRKVLAEKQSLVEGIAFSNNQLYWTSINDMTISRLNTTSQGVLKRTCDETGCKNATVEKIVRLSAEDKPRGIAIDSCNGNVYWTNWNSDAPSIQRASQHNGYKVQSIIQTDIRMPNGIAIDHKLRKLYWCDAKLDKIETCEMDGSRRVVLLSAAPEHPFAIAIWDNYVFWTDWIVRGVYKADKYTGQNPVQIKRISQRPMGIVVAAPSAAECPVDQCSVDNGGCPPDYDCIFHHLGPRDTGAVECRANKKVLNEVLLPKSRCRHGKNGTDCDPKNYHDIIMDSLERYRHVDLYPMEPSLTASTTYASEEPITTESTTTTTTSKATTSFVRIEVKSINTSSTEQSVTTITAISANPVTTNQPTPSTNTETPSPTPVSIHPPMISSQNVTSPSTQLSNQTSTTSAPSNGSTAQPCQIVQPAALQPTTDSSSQSVGDNNDCKKPNQFKCYLSERTVCISGEKRCDGYNDCPSKEDENDCYLSNKSRPYVSKQETNWHRYVTVILIILAAALAALFLVFGHRSRRRWFVGSNGAFNHRRMFDEHNSGTNIEISNPMFDEDDPGNLVHCAFSIDLNERTTNFSNPLYERQVLLMNDKHVTSN